MNFTFKAIKRTLLYLTGDSLKMTTRVIEGDLCGCCALTKPTCEVFNRRPEKKRFWNVHAAPGDPTAGSTPKSESAFAQKSLSQTKRPLELFFEKNSSFAPTPDTKYRKVLPFLAAGYLTAGKLREEEDAFVHRLVTLGTERTREKYSTNSFVVPKGPAPNGEPRLYTIGTFKKEEKQGFPLHSGSRRSYSADVTITAPEERSRWASSIGRCWNLPSGGLKNLRHPSTRQQRTQKHSGQHQGTFLIQPPILDSSGFHARGTATYVSSDVIENFHVGMPSLLEEDKNIELLPAALQNAITYLAVTKFPRGRKLKKKFLLPPQAVQFANRVTLVLDMDETLMHCSLQPLETQPDFLVQFADTNLLGHVYVRPFAKLFLDLASQICEIVVFTASTQAYADQVLAQLDPENRFVQHRLYRQHCTVINGGHVKDLRLLGRDASKVVLADNSPISMALQPDNGIIVSAWTTDYDDKELMDLLMLLQHIATLNDVQEFLRSRYEFRKWINQVRPPLDPL